MSANRTTPYLRALAAAALEAARDPKLLPVFLRIVKLAPRTIRELSGRGFKAAASPS
jgi:hypothetical protein